MLNTLVIKKSIHKSLSQRVIQFDYGGLVVHNYDGMVFADSKFMHFVLMEWWLVFTVLNLIKK